VETAATATTTTAAATAATMEITVQEEVVEAEEVAVEVRTGDPAVGADQVETEIGTVEGEEGTETVKTAEMETVVATAAKILTPEDRVEVYLTWIWTSKTFRRRPHPLPSGSLIIRTSMQPKFSMDFSI
jgi:hypothetical protein